MANEQVLVLRCLNGEQDAWESLVKSHGASIMNLSYRFTRRWDVAEDLTQEIFLRAYRCLGSFKSESGSLRTWLLRVTRNLLVDHHRKERRFQNSYGGDSLEMLSISDDRELGPLRILEQEEASGIVSNALMTLAPEIREALILRDLEGKSYREIAEISDAPEGTIKSRVSRGRMELAKRASCRRLKMAS